MNQLNEQTFSESMQAGANAAMDIFERVDKTKPKFDPVLHSAQLTDDKSVEYFLKKLQEIENKYRKTEVHAYSPEGQLLATVPTVNLEDTTDLTQGFSTMRNTLKGFVNMHKKVKADVLQSGVYYSHKEGHAA